MGSWVPATLATLRLLEHVFQISTTALRITHCCLNQFILVPLPGLDEMEPDSGALLGRTVVK